jgi:hypothetical protein
MRRTRRGRPGLIGTAARTAVIAGTATAVTTSVVASKKQQAHHQAVAQQAQIDAAVQQAVGQQAAQQPAPVEPIAAAPTAAGRSTEELIAELHKLAELRQAEVINEDEFDMLKAKLLMGQEAIE